MTLVNAVWPSIDPPPSCSGTITAAAVIRPFQSAAVRYVGPTAIAFTLNQNRSEPTAEHRIHFAIDVGQQREEIDIVGESGLVAEPERLPVDPAV